MGSLPPTDTPLWRARALRADARVARARSRALRAQAGGLAQDLFENLFLAGDRRGDSSEARFSLCLGRMPSSVPMMRHALRRWLECVGVEPDEAQEIALACSEAFANAVEHPVRPVREAFELVATQTDEGLEVAVRDFGGWNAGGSVPTRGRGLELMRTLMDSLEVVTGDEGTELVMRRSRGVRRPPTASPASARAGSRT